MWCKGRKFCNAEGYATELHWYRGELLEAMLLHRSRGRSGFGVRVVEANRIQTARAFLGWVPNSFPPSLASPSRGELIDERPLFPSSPHPPSPLPLPTARPAFPFRPSTSYHLQVACSAPLPFLPSSTPTSWASKPRRASPLSLSLPPLPSLFVSPQGSRQDLKMSAPIVDHEKTTDNTANPITADAPPAGTVGATPAAEPEKKKRDFDKGFEEERDASHGKSISFWEACSCLATRWQPCGSLLFALAPFADLGRMIYSSCRHEHYSAQRRGPVRQRQGRFGAGYPRGRVDSSPVSAHFSAFADWALATHSYLSQSIAVVEHQIADFLITLYHHVTLHLLESPSPSRLIPVPPPFPESRSRPSRASQVQGGGTHQRGGHPPPRDLRCQQARVARDFGLPSVPLVSRRRRRPTFFSIVGCEGARICVILPVPREGFPLRRCVVLQQS